MRYLNALRAAGEVVRVGIRLLPFARSSEDPRVVYVEPEYDALGAMLGLDWHQDTVEEARSRQVARRSFDLARQVKRSRVTHAEPAKSLAA